MKFLQLQHVLTDIHVFNIQLQILIMLATTRRRVVRMMGRKRMATRRRMQLVRIVHRQRAPRIRRWGCLPTNEHQDARDARDAREKSRGSIGARGQYDRKRK